MTTPPGLKIPGRHCEELQVEPLFRTSQRGLLAVPLTEASGNHPAAPHLSKRLVCFRYHLKTQLVIKTHPWLGHSDGGGGGIRRLKVKEVKKKGGGEEISSKSKNKGNVKTLRCKK